MATVPLFEFIGVYRDELIRRCNEKAAHRSSLPSTNTESDAGVPLFLDQLVRELRAGPSKTHEISKGAAAHGHDLWLEGFTVSQVVHDYGDVCQSVTDLAVELDAPIDTEDFRTMNRCLDDAIASAVTEHAHRQAIVRDGESSELLSLVNTALMAFEVLQTGGVGVSGATGGLLSRCLLAIRKFAELPSEEPVRPRTLPEVR